MTAGQFMQKTFQVRVFMCVRTILMAAVQPIRTVQDLLAHAITTWVQPITICLPAAQGVVERNSLKVTLRETDSEHPIPMPLFEYELELLVKEGTAAGGRKWWFRARDEPQGTKRQAKFDISILFVCPHYRKGYKKQETLGDRESRHIDCVQCQAQCRLKGIVVTSDPSVALIITGTLKQSVRDIVQLLRTDFDLLKHGKAEILKLGLKYQVAFVFPNYCSASDAQAEVDAMPIERSQLKQQLKANERLQVRQQARHFWHVYALKNEHNGHVQPIHPSQKGMYLTYEMTKEVADMSAAGVSPASIIKFISDSGRIGMLTAHKVEHIRSTVLSDLETYTFRPRKNESAAQTLINMLACRKREQGDVNWICLYTDYSADAERLMANGEDESVSYDSLTMYTCTGESASLAVGDPQPDANSNSWLQGLAKFFEDQWSGVVGMMSRPPTDAPPRIHSP
jgi:hypothetical protein